VVKWQGTFQGSDVFCGGSPRFVNGDIQACYIDGFFMDGSLMDVCAGFAIHWTGEGGFGYEISSPADVFTVELTALFVTLRHIGEVIQPLEKYLILTDSLSSVRLLLSRSDSSAGLKM
jgi:hypothetical protein